MDSPEPLVLYEDNHLLVLAKPAGLCSVQASAEQPSAHAWASGYLKRKYAKPGNVFVGVVHRLDRATSGVLVLARTSKAAARLSSQWRAGHIQKTYWAVVPAPLRLPDPCLLRDYLTEADGRPAIVPAPMPDDSPPRRGGGGSRSGSGPLRLALTRLTRLRERGGWVLLALEPSTGRKHQLRLQLATRGYPIVGDRRYGSTYAFGQPPGQAIALHARTLRCQHPTRSDMLTFTAPLPPLWHERFGELLRGWADDAG